MRGGIVGILALWLAGPVAAQAVRVTSGEHDGFTRLVLQFPADADWQLGRVADGYELRVAGVAPVYDLSRAFDLIGRERIASLHADPGNGALQVGVACACHALPFALRPDVVVIDLRDGEAPQGWSFERGLDGAAFAPLQGSQEPPARQPIGQAPWDWRDLALGNRWSGKTPIPVTEVSEPPQQMQRPSIPVLEAALAEAFARAATQGLVDPVGKMPRPSGEDLPDPAMAHIAFGNVIAARPASQDAAPLSAEGVQCPGEARLAVQDWGDDRPIREQMADATASLSGEFDRTQPESLIRAVKFQLFLGFGAEARALMRAFDAKLDDAPLWESLSRVVDGGTDAAGPLAGMAGCDDPAALWATLADPALPVAAVNAKALLRSFSALPPHLRLQIGPVLAERFMAAGDATTAQALSDAILRPAASDDDRRARLMQVRLALEGNDRDAADRLLAPLLADPGPFQAQVLASQMDLAALTGAPVTQATVTAIEAILREVDGDSAPSLYRALALARALSGDFETALAVKTEAATQGDLWRLLAGVGTDQALLANALGVDETLRAGVPVATRRKLAERLLGLGFADAARDWIGEDDPLLLARAALLSGQPDEVLRLLGAADGEAARKIKAEALLQIDASAAVRAFADLGEAEQSQRAARLAHAWPELLSDGDETWRKLAQTLSTPEEPVTGLAQSRALAGRADETGQAVAALLATVPQPPLQ